MFTQLVESGARPERGTRGAAISFVAHYGMILAVVFTSAQAEVLTDRARDEKVDFVEPRTTEPEKQKLDAPVLEVAPLPPRVTSAFVTPLEIPNTLPEIDLPKAATDVSEFQNRRVPSALPSRDSSTAPAKAPDEPYLDFQVDRPVTLAPSSATPQYPDVLRQAGVEGEALVSFVVDTLGRVDVTSFKVIRASHDLFAAAVRNALPRMRFNPAKAGEGRVRQLVQQPFTFSIVK